MLTFPSGDDDMAQRIRAHDWRETPLGEPGGWPVALRTLVDVMLGSNQPMFVVWGQGQRLLYNDSYAAVLQGHHPRALGRPFLDVWREIADDLRPLVDAAYAGRASHMEDIVLTMERNGYPEETHFAFSYTPVRDADGAVGGFFCVCVETTARVLAEGERLEAQERVRESETRIRLMADSIPQIVWITDAAGGVEFYNRRWYDYTGADHRPITAGETAENFVHPDDAAPTMTAFGQAMRDGTPFRIEHRIRARDGSYRWFLVRGEPYRDRRTGAVVRCYGASIDIHDRREAENAQRLSEAHVRERNDALVQEVAARTAELDRMWDASPDLLLAIDFDGVFRRVNPAWTQVLGYRASELIGHHVNEFVVAEDHGDTVGAYELAAVGGSPRVQNRYRHKDGSIRHISWAAAPAGDITYATGRDVTAERQAEEALRRAEEQLRQAQKVEAVGQLTGGVAHDFNNLLTVIRGSVDLLRRPGLSDERRDRYVGAIADSADRATRLTNQLLAFARRQSLVPSVFDAAESVRAIADMLGTLATAGMEIRIESGRCPCLVSADRNQFDTALINMAVNARHAMDGQGVLIIRSEMVTRMPALRGHAARDGAFVAVSLTDSGHGIAAEHLDRIFEPFFTTKQVGEGTGLGLSQVFGFAKQSGGDVTVVSQPGTGSTFTLYLPRADADRVSAPAAGAPAVRGGGGDATILVVEDNAEVGEFARAALSELGYSVVLVGGAAQAIGELEANGAAIDAVFSDVVMPGMSGIELGATVQRRWPGLSVVLTSGYSTVLADEGSHGFELLRKPYSVEALAMALERAVASRRRA